MDVKGEDGDAGGAASLILKVQRVQSIAKAEPDSLPMSKEAAAVLAKATELFLGEVGRIAYEKSTGTKQVEYGHIASAVKEWEACDFLEDIVPKKVRASEVLDRLS